MGGKHRWGGCEVLALEKQTMYFLRPKESMKDGNTCHLGLRSYSTNLYTAERPNYFRNAQLLHGEKSF